VSISNARKAELLGVPFGTATGRLRKILLFSAIKKLGQHFCYRCGSEIEDIKEFSIEHKKSWAMSDNPVDFFFDENNISYSHLKCNVSAANKPHKKFFSREEKLKNKADKERSKWNDLSKEEQQKIRKDKYLKYGC
jgi:hypothetical protein